MKKIYCAIVLWILVVCHIGCIFFLSTQNGEETEKTSEGVSQEIADIIYEEPTEEQVNEVHMGIRTSAHIGLFLVLGMLCVFAAYTSFGFSNHKSLLTSILISSVLTLGTGFIDEWHKQFIDGRHYQLDEAFMNMISGILGIAAAIGIIYLTVRIHRLRKNKSA